MAPEMLAVWFHMDHSFSTFICPCKKSGSLPGPAIICLGSNSGSFGISEIFWIQAWQRLELLDWTDRHNHCCLLAASLESVLSGKACWAC